jgi:DNA polymerase-3 subunit epsilon
LRLVVVDVETVVGPENRHRIVALGAAVCRNGTVGHRVTWPVNPSCPVDEVTANIHGLDDAFLTEQPTFDEIVPEFLRLLRPRDGETVVLAAHNVRFDVPRISDEIARTGAPTLPDLPLLDTAGRLRGMAGLTLRSRSLSDLLDELGITNLKAHDALADATATAEAAITLIDRAAERGYTAFAGLLEEADDGRTGTVKEGKPPQSAEERRAETPWLPPAHVATHNRRFPTKPTLAQLQTWQAAIAECAALRCADIASRGAIVPDPMLRRLLFAALPTADAPGAATLLLALSPALATAGSVADVRAEGAALPSLAGSSYRGARALAVALALWLEQTLAGKRRCGPDDPCPACREGLPCPLDMWPHDLAALAIDEREEAIDAFWSPGDAPATQGYVLMRVRSQPLADAVLRHCLVWYRTHGDLRTARVVAHEAFLSGCRDPEAVALHAELVAAGGRPADLQAALADCQTTLATRNGSTDYAWNALAARAAWFSSRLTALATSPERRHHPTNPRRPPRPPRFLRTTVPGGLA